ncbi:hypothetical protein [Nocardia arthritidis]|uniref:Uncharacterized protein n=1 Tax=Nocardia arthritidis TaxID=228602 RepID=A0A6G9YUC7_9NOCA|nr:hypothetical protein [Nocardia arthritidis]QIS16473.1 hypothetical protein F5544_43330 [Nocardia arthritidis]
MLAEQLCLVVYASVKLKPHQPVYRPVAEFLEQHENLKIAEVEQDDESMFHFRAVETTYAIFGQKDSPSKQPTRFA